MDDRPILAGLESEFASASLKKKVRSGLYDGQVVTPDALKEVMKIGSNSDDPEGDIRYDSAKSNSPELEEESPVEDMDPPMDDPFVPTTPIIEQIHYVMTREEEDAFQKAKAAIHIKSPPEIAAFLYGFRTKQDYINVTMGKQIRDLETATGKIGSLVSTLGASVSSLSSGVAQVLHKLTQAIDALNEQKTQTDLLQQPMDNKERTESWVMKEIRVPKGSPPPVITLPESSPYIADAGSSKEKGKGKDTGLEKTIRENKVLSNPTQASSPWNVNEVESILDMSMVDIIEFYEITEEELMKLFCKCGPSLSEARKTHGNYLKAKMIDVLSQT